MLSSSENTVECQNENCDYVLYSIILGKYFDAWCKKVLFGFTKLLKTCQQSPLLITFQGSLS